MFFTALCFSVLTVFTRFFFCLNLHILLRLTASAVMPITAFINEGDEGKFGYLQLPYYENGSLPEWMIAQKPSVSDAKAIMRQVAEALVHVHACGVVHMDIKPANILVSSTGRPVLADFDVSTDARLRTTAVYSAHTASRQHPPSSAPLQSRVQYAGTKDYMAPDLTTTGNGTYNCSLCMIIYIFFSQLGSTCAVQLY